LVEARQRRRGLDRGTRIKLRELFIIHEVMSDHLTAFFDGLSA
jgi:hypothetical protein